MSNNDDVFRKLQKHLDKMPVGYPKTKSGVEISLLRRIFKPEQAAVALHLHYKFKNIDEIFETVKDLVESKEDLMRILDETVSNGGIFRRIRDGEIQYALLSFLLWGMYEHQLKRLNQGFLDDSGEYIMGEFGLEMATSTLPKMRVIPVEESVKVEHKVASYDEMRQLIKQAGEHIAIQECFCRKVADMQDKPCKATDRREVCMSMGDLADLYIEEGWARKIDQEEALEIVRKNEEEGLVLMPANEQEPNFMCACCSDCCGMLTLMKNFPKPAEVVASNFYAEVDTELCKGCGTCKERCPIDAVVINNNVSSIDLKRCIGCGLCVPTCPENAMHLVAKEKEVLPPPTVEDHFNTIYAKRMSVSGKLRSFAIKSMIRIATKVSKGAKA
jgi:Na+-translocating ferredoxin:NAD+ oxidoreductase RNF subunit RnfB